MVKQTPEVSYDMGRNARELVSLRFLETLSVQEMSNANDVASILSDKIEFDRSVYSEDVLRRLFSGVSILLLLIKFRSYDSVSQFMIFFL